MQVSLIELSIRGAQYPPLRCADDREGSASQQPILCCPGRQNDRLSVGEPIRKTLSARSRTLNSRRDENLEKRRQPMRELSMNNIRALRHAVLLALAAPAFTVLAADPAPDAAKKDPQPQEATKLAQVQAAT